MNFRFPLKFWQSSTSLVTSSLGGRAENMSMINTFGGQRFEFGTSNNVVINNELSTRTQFMFDSYTVNYIYI